MQSDPGSLDNVRKALDLPPEADVAPSVAAFMGRVLRREYFTTRKHGDIEDESWKAHKTDASRLITLDKVVNEPAFKKCATLVCKGIQLMYQQYGTAPSRIIILPEIKDANGTILMGSNGRPVGIKHHVPAKVEVVEWDTQGNPLRVKQQELYLDQDRVTMTFQFFHDYQWGKQQQNLRVPNVHLGVALDVDSAFEMLGVEEGEHARQARQPDFAQVEEAWLNRMFQRRSQGITAPLDVHTEKPTELAARENIRKAAQHLGVTR